MPKGDFLGEFEHLVMLVISRDGRATGAGIHAELERAARRATSVPAIYVTLARLERKGLVRSREGPARPEGGRIPRLFSLTREGSAALARTRQVIERLWERKPV